MKDSTITEAKVKKIYSPLRMPFTISSGSHKMLDNVLITLKLKNGVTGFGEGASSPHITGENQDMICKKLEKTASWLEGKDAGDYKALAECECRISCRAALTAVEMAILDAWAKTCRAPLWKLYGNGPRKIKSDITLVMNGEKAGLNFLRKMAGNGFNIFKIKVGGDFDEDVKRVLLAAREFPKSKIYLDANCGYDAAVSLKFAWELRKRGVVPAVFEQPAGREDFEGLKVLSKNLKIPVCADESADTFSHAFRIISAGGVAVNIKLMKFGMLRSREIWNLAKARGVGLMIGQMLESPLSSVCAAHFAGGLGGFDFIDLDTPFFLKGPMSKSGGIIKKSGIYDLSRVKRGIGINLTCPTSEVCRG